MNRIDVRLPAASGEERAYPIFLDGSSAAADHFADELVRRARPKGTLTVALLTDETVNQLHRARYETALAQRSVRVVTSVVPDGESSKSLATLQDVAEEWAKAGLDRQSWVLALGGGVVGDLGGFLASIFLRGLPFVQIPTTLLAQVDSSVGGKTGVNLEAGKNLLGTFLQPRFVWTDLTTLTTLPARDLGAGLAEAVKHGLLADAGLLELIEAKSDAARAADAELLSQVVARNCLIKARVVASDEHETNPAAPGGGRAQLNFGHTIGHAIESASFEDPAGALRHGEAVALGMIAALRIGVRLGMTEPHLAERATAILAALGLPTDLDRWLRPEVLLKLGVDKKRVEGGVRFVVLERVGAPRLVPLTLQKITELLKA